jgi:hypothetical protein
MADENKELAAFIIAVGELFAEPAFGNLMRTRASRRLQGKHCDVLEKLNVFFDAANKLNVEPWFVVDRRGNVTTTDVAPAARQLEQRP